MSASPVDNECPSVSTGSLALLREILLHSTKANEPTRRTNRFIVEIQGKDFFKHRMQGTEKQFWNLPAGIFHLHLYNVVRENARQEYNMFASANPP